MPLKMCFYLQMLMKLQKCDSSLERIRVLRVLCLHSLFCSNGLKRGTWTTGIIRDRARCLLTRCESSGFAGRLIPRTSPEPPRGTGNSLGPPGDARPHPGPTGQTRGGGSGPRPTRTTYPNAVLGAGLWPLALSNLSL